MVFDARGVECRVCKFATAGWSRWGACDPVQRRLYRVSSPAAPVGRDGHLTGEVQIEPAEDFNLGEGFILQLHPAYAAWTVCLQPDSDVPGINFRQCGCRSAVLCIARPARQPTVAADRARPRRAHGTPRPPSSAWAPLCL